MEHLVRHLWWWGEQVRLAHPYTYAHRNINANWYSDANHHGHTHAYQHTNADTHLYAYSNRYADTNRYAHIYADTNAIQALPASHLESL